MSQKRGEHAHAAHYTTWLRVKLMPTGVVCSLSILAKYVWYYGEGEGEKRG